jgi:putative aldouronate transport system permease protein
MTPLPTDATSPSPERRRTRREWFKHRQLLYVFAPCFAYFLIFDYLPMLGVVLAFKEYIASEGVWGSPWAGLDNFRRLFGSPDFVVALRNTIVISLLRLTFGFAAPILLALMLSELRSSVFRRWIQTVTYIPFLLSWVILGGVVLMMFAAEGPINQVILRWRDQPVEFLTDGPWFLFILVLSGIWHSAGYGAVIYLAALSGISPTLYEAARIDGAGRWQQIRHVTLPGLVPTVVVLLILNLGHILSAGFDQIYNLYNPLVFHVADILDTYVLRRMLALDIGLSVSAGVFKSVVGMVLIIFANTLARRVSNDEKGVW